MTKKNIALICALLILIGVGIYFYFQPGGEITNAPKNISSLPPFDAKNATFEVEGTTASLVNGVAEIEVIPGSASKITVRYFGNDAVGDLNGDDIPDTAFLVTQDGGGSGLFYYVIVALTTPEGYKMTNAFFLGDRIAPQSTEIDATTRELHVNYAERNPGEPMTTAPSLGVSKILKITPEGFLDTVVK